MYTHSFLGRTLPLFLQVTTCPSNFADLFKISHAAGFKIKAKSSTYRPPGFERVSVADTPFHIQSDVITIDCWRGLDLPSAIGLVTSRRPCDIIRVALTMLLTVIVNIFVDAVDFYCK